MNTEIEYTANSNRYEEMSYRRCGNSGLKLPLISLGLWHNFGYTVPFEQVREVVFHAFDQGVTHFDLANNYGPPYGTAEKNFGLIMERDFKKYRDELIISTKAGYDMWPGPYGEGSSRKYVIASLDQSLKRMKLDYVDIFYSHRFDPNTPLEETASALESIYRQGKALYIGVSSYSAEKTREMVKILKSMGVACLIHQPSYSMLNRWVEEDLLSTLKTLGVGCIAFSPLAQGLLTSKYLKEVPKESRLNYASSMSSDHIKDEILKRVGKLNEIAERRGQTLAQMALAWILRKKTVTSALIGVSKLWQLKDCLGAVKNLEFDEEELKEIDKYAVESNIDLWKGSSKHK